MLVSLEDARAVCEIYAFVEPRLGDLAAFDIAMESLRTRHPSLDKSMAMSMSMMLISRAGLLAT